MNTERSTWCCWVRCSFLSSSNDDPTSCNSGRRFCSGGRAVASNTAGQNRRIFRNTFRMSCKPDFCRLYVEISALLQANPSRSSQRSPALPFQNRKNRFSDASIFRESPYYSRSHHILRQFLGLHVLDWYITPWGKPILIKPIGFRKLLVIWASIFENWGKNRSTWGKQAASGVGCHGWRGVCYLRAFLKGGNTFWFN
jgi:hypothetical protein